MMDIDNVTTIARTALYTIINCSAPMLLMSLVIGLTVSIFRTACGASWAKPSRPS